MHGLFFDRRVKQGQRLLLQLPSPVHVYGHIAILIVYQGHFSLLCTTMHSLHDRLHTNGTIFRYLEI